MTRAPEAALGSTRLNRRGRRRPTVTRPRWRGAPAPARPSWPRRALGALQSRPSAYRGAGRLLLLAVALLVWRVARAAPRPRRVLGWGFGTGWLAPAPGGSTSACTLRRAAGVAGGGGGAGAAAASVAVPGRGAGGLRALAARPAFPTRCCSPRCGCWPNWRVACFSPAFRGWPLAMRTSTARWRLAPWIGVYGIGAWAAASRLLPPSRCGAAAAAPAGSAPGPAVVARARCWAAAVGPFTAPTQLAGRHPASGQCAAGREVRDRTPSRGAGLARERAAAARGDLVIAPEP